MRVVDNGGEWLFALIDPSVGDASNNVCYASQVTPEQWTLEQTLTSAMASSDSVVGTAAQAYADKVQAEPQHSFHFGIRYLERDDFDATLDRFRAAATDPDLAGRAALLGIYDPSEPGAYAPGMFQAFVRTDVVAGGLLASVSSSSCNGISPEANHDERERRVLHPWLFTSVRVSPVPAAWKSSPGQTSSLNV